MALTDWIIRHPHHDVVGPRFCKPGSRACGIELRAHQSRGIVDLRFCLVNLDGSPCEPSRSDWLTHYTSGRKDTTIEWDATTEVAIGLAVREREGAGIVDVRAILKSREDDSERFTDWALQVDDATEYGEMRVERGAELVGWFGKEHGSEGVVDLRLIS